MTLSVSKLTTRHAGGRGVEAITLAAAPGETIALIGPSGCGKTTLLRTIAGLLTPAEGAVMIDGRDVTALPPEKRDIALIFQNYALFPHLSLWDNVAYGLRARGVPRAKVAAEVDLALALVDLSGRSGRVDRLSGGEQQRVAVARALVTKPRALLLDEPLSNLDPGLRHKMRAGLKEILKRLGIPAIHVTHDQEEALAISERVAVLDAGRLVQLAPPEAVFRRPRNAFVARFVGAANVFSARVEAWDGDTASLRTDSGLLLSGTAECGPLARGDAVDVAIHPHALVVSPPDCAAGHDAVVTRREFLGPVVELACDASGQTLLARVPSHTAAARHAQGTRVRLSAAPTDVHVMPR